jgi:hypothetical protein
MSDKIPMFPTAYPPRADEDTATIDQVTGQVPGEIELDKIVKAQTSGPQIVKRMIELENSIWSLVGILLLLPQARRDKIGATEAIEQARLLLLRSMVLDHNLELLAGKGVDDEVGFNPSNPKIILKSTTNLKLADRYTVAFHELAEAYEKVDGGKGGSYVAGHNAAIQREDKLREQRPYLQEHNPGSGGPANTPGDHSIIIRKWGVMKLIRILIICGFGLALLCTSTYCQNAVVVQEEVLNSQTLSGHVQLGTVPSGLKNVLVEVCDAEWKKSIASTSTDIDGAFSFPAFKSKKMYYLRLSMPGANILLVKVRLKSSAPKDLSLRLTFAT